MERLFKDQTLSERGTTIMIGHVTNFCILVK